MADDPTEALVRREVRRARQILREDKLLGKLNKAFPDEPANPPGAPPVPPPVDPKPQPEPRKGLWWGEPKE